MTVFNAKFKVFFDRKSNETPLSYLNPMRCVDYSIPATPQ